MFVIFIVFGLSEASSNIAARLELGKSTMEIYIKMHTKGIGSVSLHFQLITY